MSALLKALLSGEEGSSEENCNCPKCELTAEEASRLMGLGQNPYGVKEGDMVVRSPEGEECLRFPDTDRNQLARVVQINPTLQVAGDDVYNCILAVTVGKNMVRYYPVLLEHYKPVSKDAN